MRRRNWNPELRLIEGRGRDMREKEEEEGRRMCCRRRKREEEKGGREGIHPFSSKHPSHFPTHSV